MEQIDRAAGLSISPDFVAKTGVRWPRETFAPTKRGVARAPACKKWEDAMDHVKHLREQAEQCFRLARDVTNQELRMQLEIFGREFAARANNIEAEQAEGDAERRPDA